MHWNINGIDVTGGTSICGRKWIYVSSRRSAAWVPHEEFSVPAAEAIRTLTRKGVPVIGSEKAELIRRVQDLDDFPDMPLLERVGWNGPYFALPGGQVFAPKGLPAAEVVFEQNPLKCTSAGTLAGWKKTVANPVKRQRICEFMLCMMFAGPMMHLIGRRDNAIIELQGVKGKGKSTLQLMQASIVGRAIGGGEDRYWLPLGSTANGLEDEMGWYSDSTLIGEELSLFAAGDAKKVRADKIDGLLWMLSRGSSKRRYGQTTPREYQFFASISSNGGFITLLEADVPERADALLDRLLTLVIEPGRPFGVFDFLPRKYDGSVKFAAHLEAGMAANYGVAMPAFLERLVQLRHDGPEELSARIRGHIADFCDRVGVGLNDGSAYRVAEVFGLFAAAGLAAQHFEILPKKFDPKASAVACYHLYRAGLRQRLSIADRTAAIAAEATTVDLDLGASGPTDEE